jgi:hypothetical protein
VLQNKTDLLMLSDTRKPRIMILLLLVSQGLTACLGASPRLAPAVAEPNTRPARNFTSFAHSLECMDKLLASAGGRRYLISSNGLPDKTRDIDLGADDMLINAISQMNATNKKYVFLDQALLKDFGQLELLTSRKDEEIEPQIYIRGSISQLDERTSDAGATGDYDASSKRGVSDLYFRGTRKLSIVTVDMHLVQYPSRRVIPGASVANSMVVSQRRLDGRIVGLINQGTLGLPIYIERIESKGQAVRNLIEVGVIELLGRHANVPYWSCLAASHTDSLRNERLERRATTSGDLSRITEAQVILGQIGLLGSHQPGVLDQPTKQAISRFQDQQRLLPNGIVDFDTLRALRKQARTTAEKPQPQAATPAPAKALPPPKRSTRKTEPGLTRKNCSGDRHCSDHYLNLYDYIKNL